MAMLYKEVRLIIVVIAIITTVITFIIMIAFAREYSRRIKASPSHHAITALRDPTSEMIDGRRSTICQIAAICGALRVA